MDFHGGSTFTNASDVYVCSLFLVEYGNLNSLVSTIYCSRLKVGQRNMSRYYNTSKDEMGLSRQSTKTYKVIRQKSNAELNEKLRRLDIEHSTNIAKILNEKYNLRTIHYNLTHSGGETSSDSESDEELNNGCISAESENVQSLEKKVQVPTADSIKKQNFLQLPSIMEGSPVNLKQQSKSPKLGRSPLPPLSEHGFPTRVRLTSEPSIYGNPTSTRSRQRSLTVPIGHMPGDRQRKCEFKRTKHEKSTHSDGKRVDDDKSNHSRDDDRSAKPTWESELHGCRYLRHKKHSTPDFLDTDAIFDKEPEK